MRILIYGAGVIGSLYAVLFAKAGFEVAVYARGNRLRQLSENGLLYSESGTTKRAQVDVKEVLEEQDIYDFVILPVRENQIHKALSELRENKSPTIVTMVNSLEEYSSWEKICGTGRILPAFPGAGGSIAEGILHASLTPGFIQKTTFAEISGEKTERAELFRRVLKQAKIPCQAVKDMHVWQLCHLAMVVPLADAYYEAADPKHVWRESALMRKTAKQIRENLNTLSGMGFHLSPGKMNVFCIIPESLLSIGMRFTYRSSFGDRFIYQHSIKAPEEMKLLHDQFYAFIKKDSAE